MKCLYPNCPKPATLFCTCHLDLGHWCDEHIENHYEAMKMVDKSEVRDN